MSKNELENLTKKFDSVWDKLTAEDIKAVMEFSENYKEFMDASKTEREAVNEIVKRATEKGYINLNDAIKENRKLNTGDKIYAINKEKAVALFVIGKDKIENGMNIVGSHIDSPRIDLKPNALYEDEGFALLETHYYGGIKKYQWVTIPLALHGVVVKKGGEKVNVVIGEDENDPVLYITDLLIHLSADQMEKKLAKGIEGEDLNVLIGSQPIEDKEAKGRVKLNILRLLNEKYGMNEEDFITAEFEIVPAGKSRDVGLDRSMVMAYGHDDKVCAYTSLEAILEINEPEKTCVALFVDKEEIGSNGATGMHSKFFENALAEIMNLKGEYTELNLRRALANSKMLSSDVTAAFDPIYPSVLEKKNSAYMGKGIVITKYTGSRGKYSCNDANAEFLGEIRDLFNANNITWQTGELGKVDQGGGGTIAYITAEYGMEVVDCGVALLSMHAPWEIASKVDIYETYKAYKVFLQHIK
ncbi:putative M18 family aminopeptidase 1 [Caloramator mitchellensis]|uniref:M18 family aminopeptidase n=1 Tax=Caloramator mitchellensis TaxID=908809 RepID=A0A0R3JX48_CALMK|nr:aminopeptidase [Caloramator mitchellensis]KRQ88119.1 putative M18 family aminopeptidase 1 [Caloramator mitchellensis]